MAEREPIVVPDKVKSELNEYLQAVRDGKETASFSEFKHILNHHGRSDHADVLQKGFNGEGGF